MSKPEIRNIIKGHAYLANGEGLSGQGPFISGQALVAIKGVGFSTLDIDLDNIDIRYIDNRATDSATCFIKPNVHNISIGSIVGPHTASGDGGVFFDRNEAGLASSDNNFPELKIRLTGTGNPPDVPSNDYSGLTDIISSKNNLTLEVDAVNKAEVTLKTRFVGEGWGINKLNAITEVIHDVTGQELNDDGRIGIHETNIGSTDNKSTYTLLIGSNKNSQKGGKDLKHISLNAEDTNVRHLYEGHDRINFCNQSSELIIENKDSEKYTIILKDNIDPGFSETHHKGIVKLKGHLHIIGGTFGVKGTPGVKEEHLLSTFGYNSNTVTFEKGSGHAAEDVVDNAYDNVQALGGVN
ncbi:unnamed protein product [Didymodactylos carnosus]|uniref:Uncharacterized protein n=1 Tax=Didymodactylos carnosus TaxID=1234261 RepID=A0A814QQS2_9BILA|nr:unnamed protein product [Didymodactylos carnosus]CAF1171815.1 unnamed protein product [Didymodactylos carnosus]CAF3886504.1 unnamed protein product [Didymodactylos carnosus]CAF3983110.1 unnamed protein product [Didymodactylos carnosus]